MKVIQKCAFLKLWFDLYKLNHSNAHLAEENMTRAKRIGLYIMKHELAVVSVALAKNRVMELLNRFENVWHQEELISQVDSILSTVANDIGLANAHSIFKLTTYSISFCIRTSENMSSH